MPTKKYPFKKIGESLKKLEMNPKELYGFIEDSVWYPKELFVEETHELILKEYGGYTGYETGIALFKVILKKAKEATGIYKKTAVLLREMVASSRIYQDGNHRTAIAIAETFLIMNGERIWTEDSQEIYKFIKDLLYYNLDEIAEWLENGPKKQPSNEGSRVGSEEKTQMSEEA